MNVFMLLKQKENVTHLIDTTPLDMAIAQLRADNYSASPVLSKDGRYVGCVNEGDFLWFLIDHDIIQNENANQYVVKDLIRPDYNPAVKVTVSMEELLERSMSQNFIPVIDDRDYFIGIVTRQAIIKSFMGK